MEEILRRLNSGSHEEEKLQNSVEDAEVEQIYKAMKKGKKKAEMIYSLMAKHINNKN